MSTTQIIIEEESQEFTLNSLQFMIMQYLDDNGPKTVKQLLEYFSEYTVKNMRYALRRLREWKIIKENPNLRDMRKVIYSFNGRFVL